MFARLTQTWSRVPRWLAAGAIAAMTAAGMSAPVVLTATPASAGILGTPVNAIVQGSSVSAVQSVLSTVGGTVLTPLPLVNGVLAQLPSMTAVTTLQALGLNVVPNSPVAVDSLAGASASASGTNVFPTATGADQLQAQGINGAGVGVAVLDTGIAPLPDFGSRLIAGVDFSGQGNPFLDSYGHGTFVAGLVAGDGSSSGGAYTGEAPGANLISIKVAGASGVTTVSTVIQGIAWAIANQQVYGIKVINLSLGSVPTGPTQLNPFDQAVEAAWRSGLTVVVSAGNSGPNQATITSPGDDPMVLTVGALDDHGTVPTSDDSVPAFSSEGATAANGWFKPDLVTSGRSVVSLMAPGSVIANTYPSAQVGTSNFVGSGTSFSAAITSGAAALIAQANPTAAPNEIKGRLLATATPGPTGNPFVEGHGDLDAYDAATCPPVTLNQDFSAVPMPPAPGALVSLLTTWTASTWDVANYSLDVASSNWNSSNWNSSNWNSSNWNSSNWNSSNWNSSNWNSSNWNSSAWNSSNWNSSNWNSSNWN